MPLNLRTAIHSVVSRFAASRKGNVAVIFAIACVPVIAAMGVAVDYTRAAQTSSDMQDALDAASLALSRRTDLSSLTTAQIQQFANDYFNANFHNSELQDLKLNASYTVTGPSVTISASGKLPTDFMGIIGTKDVSIGRSSTTVWGEARLRVALALDNTGSMLDYDKIGALKTATHNLLTQLKGAAAENGDVYVSIIPFVKDVNVKDIASSPYDSTPWLRWDIWNASDTGQSNGSCVDTSGTGGTSNGGGHGYGWFNDPSRFTTQSSCENHGYTWTFDHTAWDGCVTDRNQNNDVENTAPSTSDTATLFPAEQYMIQEYSYHGWSWVDACPTPMMGLSYDWTALNNKVDAMSAKGSTNQAIGLAWAWQSLTQAPFTIPAKDPDKKYKQVIILLTDGLNTQDRWYGNGYSTSTQVDARQEQLCANIKAAGIMIYTVQVNTGGDPTSTLLQQCASSSDKFFLLTTPNQIVTTFQQIGTELSDLRISQ